MTIVLVIDNSITTRTRLCDTLRESSGILPLGCAAIPQIVFEHIEGMHPNCIIIDPPAVDTKGFDLLEVIRQKAPRCKLMVLTNHITCEFRRRSQSLGVDHFFNKATEFEKAVEVVRMLGENQ